MSDPVEAIVVSALDLGEADRLVRLLTKHEGRIAVVCRGARASRRRFAGVTELGTTVYLTRGARRSGLPVAVAMERIAGPQRARDDLERIAYVAYGTELCAALAPEGAPAEKLYGLLERWLQLTEVDPGPSVASRIALEAKALTFAGLAPTLGRCAVCGAPIEEPAVFDAEAGGALHARCGAGLPLPIRALATAEALRQAPLADTPGVPVPSELTWLLSDFVQAQLGRALVARAWWSAIGS